jgi:translation initiation factor 4E
MQNNQQQGSIQVQPSILNQNQPQSTSKNYPKENSSPPPSFEIHYPFIPSQNESDPEQHINQIQNNNINVNTNLENNNINQINFDNNTKTNETEKNKNKINLNENDKNISGPNKTKLENKFSFWYRIDDIIQYQLQKQALDKKEYEVQVKKIAEFDSVEDFWGIFQHLRKPDSCRAGIEYFMFKEPIKPMWEDENNKNGGRISIKLRKDYTTIIWEEMIFALIGGILPKQMKEEINGIVVTSRKEYNTLQIWFKTYEDQIITDLEQCIRDILVIPQEVNLEIKQFNKSNSNNNKKEHNNNNNYKKSGGYHNNKGYNNNYYGEGEYEYYNKEKNEYKKNKHQNHKNK